MKRVIKYSCIILFAIILISGGIYFYLNKEGYQVVFNSNGGNIIKPLNTGLKRTVEKPDNPTKEGYIFLGWYLDSEKFDFNTKIEENITLTAHWQEEKETVYTLSFDSLGGNVISDITIKEGEELKSIPTPIKEGYNFIDWYYHNKAFDFKTPITSNMTFIAKYEKA